MTNCNVLEGSHLLGYCTATFVKWFPTFQRKHSAFLLKGHEVLCSFGEPGIASYPSTMESTTAL
jgi:hypothetical protein